MRNRFLPFIAFSGLLAASLMATAPANATTLAGSCKTSTKPVTIKYWSWGAGYSDAAKLWNSSHPNIHVVYSDIPVGNSGGYQKIFTSLKAGSGPDVAFVEFDNLSTFQSQGALLNIKPLVGQKAAAQFLPSYLSQVALTGSNSMDMAPIGGGPMALFYRKDLFTKYNIPVPTTWAQYESDATAVQTADPTSFIGNWDGTGNPNWFAGLASENGAQWFANSGSSLKVSVNGAASRQVSDQWQRMLTAKTVSNIPTFSADWDAAFAAGKIWTWPTAVWGAGVIKGMDAADSGNWAVAPLPTFGASKPQSASWGGGGLAVMNTTKHPCEAAQFALWMGTNSAAMKILNKAIGIFPTTAALLANPIFSAADPYFGGQAIFSIFKKSAAQAPNFIDGPNIASAYKAVTDGFTGSIGAGTSLSGGLDSAQAATVTALKQLGFKLTN